MRAINPPPTISGLRVDKPVLWPPNNQMVDVAVTYTAADSCGAASCRLTVTADEGGGRTPDWAIVDDHHVRLRASRAGSGDGRVYSIAVSCADAADGTTTRTVQVVVPKSQSRR